MAAREYAELIALFFLQGAASGVWLVPLSALLNAHGFGRYPSFVAQQAGCLDASVQSRYGGLSAKHKDSKSDLR
jgi:hypothetical protein